MAVRQRQEETQEARSADLRIFLLGGFRVEREGEPVDGAAWTRPTARTLVKLLSVMPGHRAHREQIVDLLWPDADLDAGLNSFAKALHRARHALEPGLERGPHSRYLRLADNVLSLDPHHVWLDLDHFQRDGSAALAHPSIEALRATLDLYGGELLPENRYSDWADAPRAAAGELALKLLLALATAHEEQGQTDRAAEALQQAVRQDPAHEEAYRRLMRIYADRGERQQALRQYQACAEAIRAELDAAPDEETQALYRSILERHPVEHHVAPSPAPEALPRAVERVPAGSYVGREQTMAHLEDLMDRSAKGRGNMVLIGGESGVGKTRLAAEASRRAHELGAVVLWGASYQQEGLLPYGAIVSALEGFFSTRPDTDRRSLASRYPELVPLLPSLAAAADASLPSSEAGADRTQLFSVLLRMLAHLVGTRHLLLVCDDLHASDVESLHLLHYLARHAERHPWLIVGTFREEDVTQGSELQRLAASATREGLCHRVDLRRLGRGECDALVRTLLPGVVPASILARLYADSLGNPLFLHEIIRAMQEQEALRFQEDGWTMDPASPRSIPVRVRELVETRVDSMDERVRLTLAVAAVSGMEARAGVVDRAVERVLACPSEEVLDALDRALETRMIEERGEYYAFRHPLLREILYERLSTPRRKRLHAVVGLALEEQQPNDFDALAFHFNQSAIDDKAAAYLERAGDHAARVHAGPAAADYYQRARARLQEQPHTPADLSRLDEKLGHARSMTGELALAREDFARALTEETDTARRIELHRKEALAWEKLGEFDRALCSVRAAEQEDLDAVPPEVLGALEITRGQIHHRRGELGRATACARRAIGAVGRDPDSVVVARATNLLAMVAWQEGRLAESRTYLERALAVAECVDDPAGIVACCGNLGQVLTQMGDHATAERYQARGLETARKIGDQYAVAMALNNLGVVAWDQGKCQEAAAHYRRSLRLREEMGDQWGIAVCCVNLAEVENALGDRDQALASCRRGIDLLRRVGDERALPVALSLLEAIETGPAGEA